MLINFIKVVENILSLLCNIYITFLNYGIKIIKNIILKIFETATDVSKNEIVILAHKDQKLCEL